MKQVHIYLYCKKEFKNTEKPYGYVLGCDGITDTREHFGRETGTYNQVCLMAIIDALKRIKPGCAVCIHTENGYVANMISSQLEEWAKRGFEEIKNSKEWSMIYLEKMKRKLDLTVQIGKHEYTEWLLENARKEKQ